MCTFCTSSKILQNRYLVSNTGLDIAENGPPQVCCMTRARETDLGSFSVPGVCVIGSTEKHTDQKTIPRATA